MANRCAIFVVNLSKIILILNPRELALFTQTHGLTMRKRCLLPKIKPSPRSLKRILPIPSIYEASSIANWEVLLPLRLPKPPRPYRSHVPLPNQTLINSSSLAWLLVRDRRSLRKEEFLLACLYINSEQEPCILLSRHDDTRPISPFLSTISTLSFFVFFFSLGPIVQYNYHFFACCWLVSFSFVHIMVGSPHWPQIHSALACGWPCFLL